jgi:hypothetical protein
MTDSRLADARVASSIGPSSVNRHLQSISVTAADVSGIIVLLLDLMVGLASLANLADNAFAIASFLLGL